jgi:hypothetical protein
VRAPALLSSILAGGLLIAACSSSPPSTGSRVETWVGTSGLTADITQIQTDAANVNKVERIGGTPGAIRTNCAVLDLDTENANQNLPSPDVELTTDLADAYAAEIQAAQDCYHGAGKSQELIARGQIAQSAADADVQQVQTLLHQLTGNPNG